MASAQKEPSLIQKGLLAKKLAGPDLLLPEVVQLRDAAEPGPIQPGSSDTYLPGADEAGSGLPEVGLYSDTGMGQPIQGPSCLE